MSTDDYEIIDVHVHLFRNLVQEKAGVSHLGRRDRDLWGIPERAIPFMDRTGISKAVLLILFPTNEVTEAYLKKLPSTLSKRERAEAEEKIKSEMPDRLRRYNEWACEVGKQSNGRLIPFIGIQPILGKQGMVEELAIRNREGAKGVKLHPAMNRVFPNDRQLWPMYEKCQELGMAILSDSGPFRGAPKGMEYGQPIHFAEVLRDFPRLTLILAHMGGAFWDERVELAKQFPNVYFDTAQGFSTPESVAEHQERGLSASDAVRIIRKIGVERIMFGTDGAHWEVLPQLEEILGLDLTEQEKQMILAENAKRILKI